MASISDTRRTLKRNIVTIVYCGLWVLFFGVIYLLFGPPPTSCFDGRQNGNEQGVDCGGRCMKQCAVNLPPTVIEAAFIAVRPGLGDVVAMVKNPNANVGTNQLHYKFVLYDASGAVLKTITDATTGQISRGPEYILPQQTRPLIQQGVAVAGTVARVEASVAVDDGAWRSQPIISPPELVLLPSPGFALSAAGSDFATYQGLLHNPTNYEFSTVNVDVVVRHNGQIMAVNRHQEFSIAPPPAKDRAVTLSWPVANPYLAAAKPADFSITVSTDIYNEGNIVKRQAPGEQF